MRGGTGVSAGTPAISTFTAVFRNVEQHEQTNILLIWALKNF
jgi:hypothetical protein